MAFHAVAMVQCPRIGCVCGASAARVAGFKVVDAMVAAAGATCVAGAMVVEAAVALVLLSVDRLTDTSIALVLLSVDRLEARTVSSSHPSCSRML